MRAGLALDLPTDMNESGENALRPHRTPSSCLHGEKIGHRLRHFLTVIDAVGQDA